ncbi:MAG: DUF4910 domain-containing protein [Bryobacterales bacterium]|nr:DUF4910 domain-containing protein [Bryobacterales bacterium]
MASVSNRPLTANAGQAMMELIRELYPICRSITGDGVRETLRIVGEHIPLEIREIPTGTQVLDWTVPKEWNIRDAYVKDPGGRKIIDFRRHNLHVASYSVPVRRTVTLAELKQHLFSLPDQPDWIPYRTTYYKEDWAFCASQRVVDSLEEGDYEVCIDSTLAPGALTFGEHVHRGRTDEEVLISCHCCHPSLANDNLSGIALSTLLAEGLKDQETRYTYRFLFIPGTIGSITWLALNEAKTAKIRHGLVAACVGDPGLMTYKKSRRGNAEIDQAVLHVLRQRGGDFEALDFSPYGYDERQYCSPGFNLPVGSLTRTPHGRYPEYHTSADNLELVSAEHLADSLDAYREIFHVLERNRRYRNTHPKGEPQLGKRGLYGPVGGGKSIGASESALLWVLNLSDGEWSLLDIADRAGLRFENVRAAADALEAHGLLERV